MSGVRDNTMIDTCTGHYWTIVEGYLTQTEVDQREVRKSLPELNLRVSQARKEGVSEVVKVAGRGVTWARTGSRKCVCGGGVSIP